jgi:putative phage-type endonuclease
MTISPNRFLAQSGTPEWYSIREGGISATSVAKAAAGPGGYDDVVRSFITPEEIPDNPYMAFGRDYEEFIVNALPGEYGIEHNDWLICADGYENAWKIATPDGLNANHTVIAEVKTTGKDWGEWKSVPIQYRRQVQWQLHVTGADSCVFGWLLRAQNSDGDFIPAWLEPKHLIVERDEKIITDLIEIGKRLQLEKVHLSQWVAEKENPNG